MPLSVEEFQALTHVLPKHCDMIHKKNAAGEITGAYIDFRQVLVCLGKCVEPDPPAPKIELPLGVTRN